MDKQDIINEIRRTAKNGKAVGQTRFGTITGVKEHQWRGKYWTNWGEAIKEAGFEPNDWTGAHGEILVFSKLCYLTNKLQKFPTKSEMQLERQQNPAFPDTKSIYRLGSKAQLVSKLIEFCKSDDSLPDVLAIISSTPSGVSASEESENPEKQSSRYVYLVSAQGAYKIGHSRAPYRRVSEIANQSAGGAELIHKIATDDPEGIEKYWHTRFEDKRISGINKQSGEWFQLSKEDVKAFKKRKDFM